MMKCFECKSSQIPAENCHPFYCGICDFVRPGTITTADVKMLCICLDCYLNNARKIDQNKTISPRELHDLLHHNPIDIS